MALETCFNSHYTANMLNLLKAGNDWQKVCEYIYSVKFQQLKSELEKAELGRNEEVLMKVISWLCWVCWRDRTISYWFSVLSGI